MPLRPYQQAAVESLRAARRAGHRRMLLVAPTGSGKTVIAREVIEGALRHAQKVLVIAHRRELLDQFWGALRARGIDAGLMRGDDERTNGALPVQLASIQTLGRRGLPRADLLIVDEAHRTPSESYARVIAEYPEATVLGLTATPARLDGSPLREHYDVMILAATYSALIDAGHIVAPVVYAPRQAPDLSKVRRVAGDYHEGELEAAMLRPHVVGNIVEEWKEKAFGRSTVVFAVGVAHSKAIQASFEAAGVRCAHLDGQTASDDRLAILLAVERGDVEVVSNVGVLCEGWDQPRVKCGVMARPTLSLTLYMQCVGRILRPWGDACPVVLDHAGNTERHGLPHEDREWSLDGRPQRLSPPTTHHVCPACYAYVRGNPCEQCGHEAPVRARELRTAEGSLEPVTARPEGTEDPRRAYYDKAVERAKYQGFKPGFASAKYKEKFGDWPPWAWSQATKAAYAADQVWQEELRAHELKKAFWERRRQPTPQEPAYTREVEADDGT